MNRLAAQAIAIARARAEKVRKLVAEIVAIQTAHENEHLTTEELARAIAQQPAEWWRELARRALVREPSRETRRLVLEQVRDGLAAPRRQRRAS